MIEEASNHRDLAADPTRMTSLARASGFPSTVADCLPPAAASASRPDVFGRYKLCEEIASGGMATVHFGRVVGDGGFSRPVAIKRLHPHLAKDSVFVEMFAQEARLAARISHPNVVSTLDVVSAGGEFLLVMEYVPGASLSHLLRAARERGETVSLPCIAAILADALAGLNAAHAASDENGKPLGLVHRDISPQNIIVGVDGRARVLDFGVAKATSQLAGARTTTGVVKGKIGYMAPEQFDRKVTSRSDIYAASVVLWEALAGQRLFGATETDGELIHRVLLGTFDAPSAHREGLPPALDALVLRGLSMDPAKRFATAAEMAEALEAIVAPALPSEVGAWVERVGGEAVRKDATRRSRGAEISLRARSEDDTATLTIATPAPAPLPANVTATASVIKSPRARSVSLRTAAVTGAAGFALALALIGVARTSSAPVVAGAPTPPPSSSAVVEGVAPAESAPSRPAPTVDLTILANAPLSRAKANVVRRSSPPRAPAAASGPRAPTAEVLRALDSRR